MRRAAVKQAPANPVAPRPKELTLVAVRRLDGPTLRRLAISDLGGLLPHALDLLRSCCAWLTGHHAGLSSLRLGWQHDAMRARDCPPAGELLLRSGFRYVDTFFKWYNFCGMVAVK